MSRTDKDAPHWVRAEYYSAMHSPYCLDGGQSKYRHQRCNLPAEPVRMPNCATLRINRCAWEPVWDRWHDYDRPHSKEERRIEWCARERAHVRNFCHMAARDPDDPDLLEPVRQHRHSSYKGWWW